jgi:hypothetical protein
MALEIKVEVTNNKDGIILSDVTGDYNAVTNPGGWGSPNDAYTNPPVTAISLDIYTPGTSTTIGSASLIGTTYFTSTDRAYDVYKDVSTVVPTFDLADGVYKYVVTYTISATPYVITKYSLRDNLLRCSIAELALSDMESNGYEEIKDLYDRMVQAFECEEYVLAQELYEEIQDAFTDCSPYCIKCNC